MDNIDRDFHINEEIQSQKDQSEIDEQKNVKLVLDLSTNDEDISAIIEYDSSCPPISEDQPEEFFYDDSLDLIEVEFKGSRRAYFYKDKDLQLSTMDYVIVEAEKGFDLGRVYLSGDLVHIKRKGQVLRKDIIRKVIRKAEPEDLEKMLENRRIEESAFLVCRKKIEKHELLMKLVDVEYQFDRNRVTFYFTSDKRIDFRELVKDLAAEYKTRIELRQIGVRDEAKMIGGISSCGRELCCCTWLNNFKRITTQAAKIQMLQLNPVKLSGQCGRLKCCLMYELDNYIEALRWFPDVESKVNTPKGEAVVEKVDIFKDTLYLHYLQDDTWEKLTLHQFNELYHDQFPNTKIKEYTQEKLLEEDDDLVTPVFFSDEFLTNGKKELNNSSNNNNEEEELIEQFDDEVDEDILDELDENKEKRNIQENKNKHHHHNNKNRRNHKHFNKKINKNSKNNKHNGNSKNHSSNNRGNQK